MSTVTIFGSALPVYGSKEYSAAYQLGYFFGSRGITVCSGGYQGIMEAVSHGSFDAGGKSIGVIVDLFNRTPNPYLSEVIETRTLFERISKMIELASAFVILPGGTGTLLETAVVWEFINKNFLVPKPVAAVGEPWIKIIDAMEKQLKKENRPLGTIETFDKITDCGNFILNKLKPGDE